MAAVTDFEAHHRTRKALALVNVIDRVNDQQLLSCEIDPDTLEEMGDGGWEILAELAHVNPPSTATRCLVVWIIRDRETTAADPFAGLPT